MISASFNLHREDLIALTMHYHSNSALARSSRLLNQLCIPVVLCGLAAWWIYRNPEFKLITLPLFIIAAIFAAAYPALYLQYIRVSAQAQLKNSNYQKTLGPHTITLKDDGIFAASSMGEGRLAWSAVTKGKPAWGGGRAERGERQTHHHRCRVMPQWSRSPRTWVTARP